MCCPAAIHILYTCMHASCATTHMASCNSTLTALLASLQFLGVLLAAIMGLQHALAMVGGLITPPLVVSSAANDLSVTQFLISSALIVSGIFTIIHVS